MVQKWCRGGAEAVQRWCRGGAEAVQAPMARAWGKEGGCKGLQGGCKRGARGAPRCAPWGWRRGVVEAVGGGTSLRKPCSAPRPPSPLPSSPVLALSESSSTRSPSRPDPTGGAIETSGRGGGAVAGGEGGTPPLMGPARAVESESGAAPSLGAVALMAVLARALLGGAASVSKGTYGGVGGVGASARASRASRAPSVGRA